MGDETALDLTLEGLVHDLNNVFETISDAADLLADDPRWAGVAASIQRSVSRGRRIVGGYSASAREEHELEGIVRGAIEFGQDLLKAIAAPSVRFDCRIPSGTRVTGSAASWERILLNLFLNSAQAMKGGGMVEVSACQTDDGFTEILVSDDGPGIAAEILPLIFDPHFSTKTSGGGLGLHIVKSLVQENGGIVTAANRPAGQGAVISIVVPQA